MTIAEAASWRRLIADVAPINATPDPPRHAEEDDPEDRGGGSRVAACSIVAPDRRPPPPPLRGGPPPRAGEDRSGLDATWDRRLARGQVEPDVTLDLHGATLDAAHARLDGGLAQAKALGARLVLVIAGRARPVEAADRGSARGAIRAKLGDWIAAGPHARDIAAIRPAHRRHGGIGALYLVLRRRR